MDAGHGQPGATNTGHGHRPAPAQRCPYCGAREALVYVHGHGQCGACGTNIRPCCDGANPSEDGAAAPGALAHAEPTLLARVFEQLGGVDATVTTEALEFALAQRLGTDLDEARIVVEAGERIGQLRRVGDSWHRLHRG